MLTVTGVYIDNKYTIPIVLPTAIIGNDGCDCILEIFVILSKVLIYNIYYYNKNNNYTFLLQVLLFNFYNYLFSRFNFKYI